MRVAITLSHGPVQRLSTSSRCSVSNVVQCWDKEFQVDEAA